MQTCYHERNSRKMGNKGVLITYKGENVKKKKLKTKKKNKETKRKRKQKQTGKKATYLPFHLLVLHPYFYNFQPFSFPLSLEVEVYGGHNIMCIQSFAHIRILLHYI